MKQSKTAQRPRDNFPVKVIRILAARVNNHCSNPHCRAPTTAPTSEVMGVSNIGKAAHITAAARGGPRYDELMTPAERSSISNAIWLCAVCADKIDKDPIRFTTQLLKKWKEQAERDAAEQQGKTPPSPNELAVYKAHVLGQDVSGSSITRLVSTSLQIAEHEFEKLDPQVQVQINKQGAALTIAVKPRTNFDFSMHVSTEHAPDFPKKYAALTEHGEDLAITSQAVQFTDFPLFEHILSNSHGTLIITPPKRRANTRLTFTAPGQDRSHSIEINGELAKGGKSVTFRGSALDGLLTINYRIPLDKDTDAVNSSFNVELRLKSWLGKPVTTLPHIQRFAKLLHTLVGRTPIEMCLEVGGNPVVQGTTTNFRNAEELRPFAAMVDHLARARDILKILGADALVRSDVPVSAADFDWLGDVWSLLVMLPTLKGKAIGSARLEMVPTDEAAAERLRKQIREFGSLRLVHTFDRPINVLGTLVQVGPLTLDYSAVRLEVTGGEETVKPNVACQVDVLPEDECTLSVHL